MLFRSPAAGTGTVSFWGVVNAVNGDGSASSADKWNLNHIIITELIPTGISEATQNVGLSAFPNPVNDNLHINMDLIQTGNYILSIFNLTGDKILDRKIEVGLSSAENINTADWNPGVYEIVLENETVRKVIKVIKQ